MKKLLSLVALAMLSVISYGAKYVLVTSTSDLTSGDKVIIAANTKGVVAGALSGTNMPSVAVTFSDDKSSVTTSDAYEYTINGGGSSWILMNENGAIGCSSAKNSLGTDATVSKFSSNWELEIDYSTGDITYTCKSNAYENTKLQYNSSAKYFANYSSKQTVIQFYKKVNSSTPSIECGSSLDFGNVQMADGMAIAEVDFAVNGENLTSNISATISAGADNFTVTPASLSAAGGTVKVGFIADKAGEYSGVLLLQSGSVSVSVNLSAIALEMGGGGTKDAPYACADVISLGTNDASVKAWVMGYILGSAATGPAVASKANNTSLALADDMNGSNLIAVALPSGDIRNELNVADHPNYVGLRVKVYGALQKYFGGFGVKSTSDYEWLDTPTDVEQVQSDKVQSTKILRNGQIFIIRCGQLYDTTGRQVK